MRSSRPRRSAFPLSRTLTGATDFGLALRAYRRAAQVPIDRAATMLGVSKQFLSDVENGKPTVQLDKAIKAGRAFGMLIDYRTQALEPGVAEEAAHYQVMAPRASHRRREQQSIALHRAIAKKLIATPEEVIAKAIGNINRWSGEESQAALYSAWRVLLGLPPGVIAEVLVSDSQSATQLRQSSPFAGVLSAEERSTILEGFYSEDS